MPATAGSDLSCSGVKEPLHLKETLDLEDFRVQGLRKGELCGSMQRRFSQVYSSKNLYLKPPNFKPRAVKRVATLSPKP